MGNVKMFWGVDHKVGTTMLAQMYAEMIANNNNASVLLLTLSDNLGDDFFPVHTYGLNEIRSRLSCGLLTEDLIREYATKYEDIHKINGLIDPKEAYAFTIEMVTNLIEVSSRTFKDVVVDCGTGVSNPLSIASLKSQYDNIFIFNQSESSLRRWEHISEHMSDMGIIPQSVIINKFIKGDKQTINTISQRTGMPQNLFKTVIESDFGHQAETERKTLLYFGEKQIEKDLSVI